MPCPLQGVSQWHPPAGWAAAAPGSAPAPTAGEAGAAQPPTVQQQQQQQQAPPASTAYTPGYYYRDVGGQMQGPFTLEQLRGWRGSLPMDLPVLQLTEPQPADQQAASGDAAPGQGESQEQEQQSGSRWVQLELARLLGDDELLGRWRLEHPEQVRCCLILLGSEPPEALAAVAGQCPMTFCTHTLHPAVLLDAARSRCQQPICRCQLHHRPTPCALLAGGLARLRPAR